VFSSGTIYYSNRYKIGRDINRKLYVRKWIDVILKSFLGNLNLRALQTIMGKNNSFSKFYRLYLLAHLLVFQHVRNHVKLGVFSKDTLLCGGYWLWAWWISWGLQTCIAERLKVPNG
jgi:hypothetical protein